MQEFRSSGVQEFRSSGVQEFRREAPEPVLDLASWNAERRTLNVER
jgi:hypothetical protein